jgi:phosphatidylserine decarboxylase precursor-related protein
LILVIILQFFRNPKRIFTTNENQILAPVDGKVVVIEEVYEGEYYKDKRLQISIFMSINVHVTRYAISGIVKFSKYHPGKFWSHGIRKLVKKTNELPSSLKTIRLVYLIPSSCRCISRRIVNYAEEGMQGTDAGFIKFGSRVDLFYLSELQSTCLIKSSMENHYCYKSIMIEKELDTRFQEAVTIRSDDSKLCPRCPVTFICLLQTGYLLYFRTKTNTNLSFKDAFKTNA